MTETERIRQKRHLRHWSDGVKADMKSDGLCQEDAQARNK